MSTNDLSLTPTEELILDVLVSRFRLGDRIWPFDTRNKKALKSLESRGLIELISGNVNGTVRARITDEALYDHGSEWFQPSTTVRYLPERELEWVSQDVENLNDILNYTPEVDKRAVNAAHLLLIQMINMHFPSHISQADNNGIMLYSGRYRIEISADGRSYRLLSPGKPDKVTTQMSEVLRFVYTEAAVSPRR